MGFHRPYSLALSFVPAMSAAVLAAAVMTNRSVAGTIRMTFTGDSPESRVALDAWSSDLPVDWTPYEFLVLEFKASSSQRFDVGIDTAQGKIAKRIAPFAGVWVRAAIPLRFYRQPPGSAVDLAATYNQPRGSYWINISGPHGPTTGVRALTFRMDRPVGTGRVRAIRPRELARKGALARRSARGLAPRGRGDQGAARGPL
jgi:hypothetical protein